MLLCTKILSPGLLIGTGTGTGTGSPTDLTGTLCHSPLSRTTATSLATSSLVCLVGSLSIISSFVLHSRILQFFLVSTVLSSTFLAAASSAAF